MEEVLSNEEFRNLILSTEEDVQAFHSSAALAEGDKVKFICKVKGVVIAALNIAKIFVGKKEKEVLNGVISMLQALCP